MFIKGREVRFFLLIIFILMQLSCSALNIFPSATTQAPTIDLEETPTPYPTPLLMDDAYATSSSRSYIPECLQISPKVSAEPIGYKGIVPGESSVNDVRNRIGDPSYITDILGIWMYEGFSIEFKKDQVFWISVDDDSDIQISLHELIEKHGCPEIIIAYDPNEESMGVLGVTSFVYPRAGVEFLFYEYPVRLTDTLAIASFFLATPLYDYLVERSGPFGGTVQMVTWKDAVIK